MNYAREAAASRQAVSGVLGALKGNWGGENLQSLISQWPAIEAQIDRFGTDLAASVTGSPTMLRPNAVPAAAGSR